MGQRFEQLATALARYNTHIKTQRISDSGVWIEDETLALLDCLIESGGALSSSHGSITLGELRGKLTLREIACSRCDRCELLRLDRLIGEHGAGVRYLGAQWSSLNIHG